MLFKKILVMVFIWCYWSTAWAQAPSIEDFLLEQPLPLPLFEYTDQNGTIHSLNEYQGKVVLLNFWATWCVPCVAEMPDLSRLQAALGGTQFDVVPISLDIKGATPIEAFYEQHQIQNLPTLVDTKRQGFDVFKLRALPTSFVLNKQGQVVAVIEGMMEWNTHKNREWLRTNF